MEYVFSILKEVNSVSAHPSLKELIERPHETDETDGYVGEGHFIIRGHATKADEEGHANDRDEQHAEDK